MKRQWTGRREGYAAFVAVAADVARAKSSHADAKLAADAVTAVVAGTLFRPSTMMTLAVALMSTWFAATRVEAGLSAITEHRIF